jgi:methylenetetrahydrofolate dehydrogenase (NADP+)/methenyltetrahydrofolate cyclohydrolase
MILDGKAVASKHREQIAKDAASITANLGRKPGLGVILVGDNPASKVYVGAKTKAAVSCGLDVFDKVLPETASQEELQSAIAEFNSNNAIDGILLQLPLPKHLNELQALNAISPEKDADGLHPKTQGMLLRGAHTFTPCTPLGCMALIDEACEALGHSLAGKRALVIGRSILVGKPVALLLLERGATVTIAHSKTVDLPKECSQADIVIAAIGKPEFVRGEWLKSGAIVIDVGINRLESGKLVGDVHFESAKERAFAISPVPNGVGPMTITMLLKNTVISASRKKGAHE